MNVASILSTGQISGIYHNQSAYEEMSYQVVAGSAESQTGGVRINMIPKQGGNRFTWDAVVTYTNENLQADNNDAGTDGKGLVVPPNLYRLRDYNVSIGGPIKRDRVWFFFSPRVWGAENYILNQYFPDGSPARDESLLQSYTTRITAQPQFEAQGHRAVRSAAETPRLLPERDGLLRSEGRRRAGHVQPRHPGQVDVDDDEPPARRSRLLGELHGIQARAAGYGPDRAKRHDEPVGRYLEIGFGGHEPVFHQRPDPMVRESVDVAEHRRVRLLRHRIPQPQDGHAMEIRLYHRRPRKQRPYGPAVQQRRTPAGRPVQLADHLAFGAERRLRPVHSGHVAARKADLEPRSALRTLQCGGCRADVARRPVRGRAPLRPDPQPAELHRLGAATSAPRTT